MGQKLQDSLNVKRGMQGIYQQLGQKTSPPPRWTGVEAEIIGSRLTSI